MWLRWSAGCYTTARVNYVQVAGTTLNLCKLVIKHRVVEMLWQTCIPSFYSYLAASVIQTGNYIQGLISMRRWILTSAVLYAWRLCAEQNELHSGLMLIFSLFFVFWTDTDTKDARRAQTTPSNYRKLNLRKIVLCNPNRPKIEI